MKKYYLLKREKHETFNGLIVPLSMCVLMLFMRVESIYEYLLVLSACLIVWLLGRYQLKIKAL